VSCGCKLSFGKQVADLPNQLRPRFLSGLPKADVDAILSVAKHRQFRRSSVVLHEGDPAEGVFLLTSGHGRQFVTTNDGRKVLLYWLTAGQVFGGVAMLSTPIHYLASTEVVADSCALMWDRRTIREFVGRFPVLLDNALSIAATENVAWSIATQVSLSCNDARGRVAHLLISLACGVGKTTRGGVELRITNEDLAAGANVTPFTASRILNEWQRAGVLTKGRGKVLLRNPQLLLDCG
jgi:CRP-like cAMP-binding protein